jgi:hypothetical protein
LLRSVLAARSDSFSGTGARTFDNRRNAVVRAVCNNAAAEHAGVANGRRRIARIKMSARLLAAIAAMKETKGAASATCEGKQGDGQDEEQ